MQIKYPGGGLNIRQAHKVHKELANLKSYRLTRECTYCETVGPPTHQKTDALMGRAKKVAAAIATGKTLNTKDPALFVRSKGLSLQRHAVLRRSGSTYMIVQPP